MTVIIMLCSLDKRAVITSIMTFVLFKKRFQKAIIYLSIPPHLKSEFTQKYRNIFEAAEHVQMIYLIKYRKRRCILCCLLSVLGQATYLGKERI